MLLTRRENDNLPPGTTQADIDGPRQSDLDYDALWSSLTPAQVENCFASFVESLDGDTMDAFEDAIEANDLGLEGSRTLGGKLAVAWIRHKRFWIEEHASEIQVVREDEDPERWDGGW